MTEQARQSLSRISVIFHKQNAQRLCWFLRSFGTHAALFDVVRYRVKCELEGGAIPPATALQCDRAAVQIDKMPGNRQTQAKSAKLTADGRISLLEWREE